MAKHALIYDGNCPFCRRGIQWLRRLDWLDCFECIPAASRRAVQVAPAISYETLMTAVHCITVEGRVIKAAAALRFAGLRVPLLAPLALICYLPGLSWLAEKAYRAIARRRYQLCDDTKCEPIQY